MLKQENLAANFCGLLAQNGYKGGFSKIFMYKIKYKLVAVCLDNAIEWRILGQERDGSLLAAWISVQSPADPGGLTHIGRYNPAQKTFDILYTFAQRKNVIQASVNHSQTLLGYVIKDAAGAEGTANGDPIEMHYKPYLVEINNSGAKPPTPLLVMGRTKQVMVQFLWRKQSTFEKQYQDKFLVFIHEECKIFEHQCKP